MPRKKENAVQIGPVKVCDAPDIRTAISSADYLLRWLAENPVQANSFTLASDDGMLSVKIQYTIKYTDTDSGPQEHQHELAVIPENPATKKPANTRKRSAR